MLTLRKELIGVILQAEDLRSLKSVLRGILKKRMAKGITLTRLSRFLPSLESDIKFELQKSHPQHIKDNLKEALRLIREKALL